MKSTIFSLIFCCVFDPFLKTCSLKTFWHCRLFWPPPPPPPPNNPKDHKSSQIHVKVKKSDFYGMVCYKQTVFKPSLTGLFFVLNKGNNFLKCFTLIQNTSYITIRIKWLSTAKLSLPRTKKCSTKKISEKGGKWWWPPSWIHPTDSCISLSLDDQFFVNK